MVPSVDLGCQRPFTPPYPNAPVAGNDKRSSRDRHWRSRTSSTASASCLSGARCRDARWRTRSSPSLSCSLHRRHSGKPPRGAAASDVPDLMLLETTPSHRRRPHPKLPAASLTTK